MIGIEREGGLIILIIDRQEKANSLTRSMLHELLQAVEEASRDERVNALILTGKGKVFSAGADLDAARAGLATDPVWEMLSNAMARAPFLTISALNGTAAGGALGMVLATDLRVAHPSAKIFYPVMKLGFLPQPSDPGRLAALVGPARAKLILMAGARIETEEALSIGFVDRISETPLEAAKELAADALSASRSHVAAMKAMQN